MNLGTSGKPARKTERSADYTDYADFGRRVNLLLNNKIILGLQTHLVSRPTPSLKLKSA